MPRRSIILQELEENEKKLTSYNQAVEGYNAETERRNANYNAAVTAFNTHAAPGEGYEPNYNMGFMGPGTGLFTDGKVYSERNRDGTWSGNFWSQPGRELTWDEAVAIGESQKTPEGFSFSKMPTARPEAGSFITYDWNDPNYTPITDPNNALFQKDLAASQAMWDKEKAIYDAGGIMYYENAANYRDGKAYNIPAGSYEKAYRAPTQPTAPPTPEEPGFYTLSRREEQELVNPTLTGAEAALAANKGAPAKTNLADQASSGASVYAERDKDEAIEQSGILARVLSGKLA